MPLWAHCIWFNKGPRYTQIPFPFTKRGSHGNRSWKYSVRNMPNGHWMFWKDFLWNFMSMALKSARYKCSNSKFLVSMWQYFSISPIVTLSIGICRSFCKYNSDNQFRRRKRVKFSFCGACMKPNYLRMLFSKLIITLKIRFMYYFNDSNDSNSSTRKIIVAALDWQFHNFLWQSLCFSRRGSSILERCCAQV